MSKIIVKSKSERGFRRAGFQFTREGVELDERKLNKEQLETIRSEPNLVVVEPKETDAERKAREKAEQAARDAASKADADALEREKKAKQGTGQAKWEAAEAVVRKAHSDESWSGLSDAARVALIEAAIAASDGK